MGLAFWLYRCGDKRPLASYEPDSAPLIPCARRRGHRGKHRSWFGLEW